MGDSVFRRDVPHKYKSKSPSLNNYFEHIGKELDFLNEKGRLKPSPEFFDGAEKEKLLAAQARGEPLTVRIMLTHKKEIDETFVRIIALEDAKIAAERKKRE